MYCSAHSELAAQCVFSERKRLSRGLYKRFGGAKEATKGVLAVDRPNQVCSSLICSNTW